MSELPFSQSCENNKDPILSILKDYFKTGSVLEMGHGTGQHAEYFYSRLAVEWFPADTKENNPMMVQRIEQNELPIAAPFTLKVGPEASMKDQLGCTFDHVFTANTLHIMSQSEVDLFCREVKEIINPGGYLLIYGPFKFNGKFTSESNEKFNEWLKEQNPESCIKDFEHINKLLDQNKFEFVNKHDLPANNHILAYQKFGI
jgi:cyclopropane fatty-acyl-phospholipid synthase-like methyltransferase